MASFKHETATDQRLSRLCDTQNEPFSLNSAKAKATFIFAEFAMCLPAISQCVQTHEHAGKGRAGFDKLGGLEEFDV